MAKNILISDDAAFMRMMIKDILTKNGYNVVGEAENGARAVEKYNELKPDLVLNKVFVNNTNRMVTIAHYGLAATDESEAIPAFKDGDYVKVQFVSDKNNTVEFTLAECKNGNLSVIEEWKEIDLTKLGNLDSMDVIMTSNRNDLPMSFCIDNLYISASINM